MKRYRSTCEAANTSVAVMAGCGRKQLRRENTRLKMEIEILKGGHLLRSGIEVKYAFVEKNRRQYGVAALCEALQVSRSGH